MKQIQEVIRMRNNLRKTIEILTNDPTYSGVQNSQEKLRKMRSRLRITESVLEDFTLYQWLLGDSAIKEQDIQDFLYKNV